MVEGKGFRDEFQKYDDRGIVILGISADSPAKQRKFVEKYGFRFPLLCDEDRSVLKQYGVWGLKKFMGRAYRGIHRVTYLIDNSGKILKVYPKVRPKDHAVEVLSDLGYQESP